MRTLKLTLAYNGTRYAGWQVQRGTKPTIQGTLQATLAHVLGERVTVVGSGRTDAGVHALGQVAHVKTRSRIPVEKLLRALNGLLPPDIAVTRIEEVTENFHAQYHAAAKRYRYTIVTSPAVLPFDRPYVHHVRIPLNVSLMRNEAAALKGRHDFRAFCASGSSVRDTHRTLSRMQLRRQKDRVIIELDGDGFLYKMVRGIVGTLIDIGRGRLPAGTMAHLLKTKDRRLVGPTAPARGLMLMGVTYDT